MNFPLIVLIGLFGFPPHPAMKPDQLWPSLQRLHLQNNKFSPAPSCVEQSTQWSACSQSCGAGVSTRVSNQNPACRLQIETRLCKVRPCHTFQPAPRKPMVSANKTHILYTYFQVLPLISVSRIASLKTVTRKFTGSHKVCRDMSSFLTQYHKR